MKFLFIQKIIFWVTILIIAVSCRSDKISNNSIIAVYGDNHKVTKSELESYVQDWLYLKKFPNKNNAYQHALNDLLVNQFKRMEFFELNYDSDTELLGQTNRIINEELVAEYFEEKYLGKYANESNAQKLYPLINKEIIYRAIYLRKPINNKKEQLDSLYEKAEEIRKKIFAGDSFSNLVQQYSTNEISLKNDGKMPPADWKQTLTNPIGKKLFEMRVNDVEIIDGYSDLVVAQVMGINSTAIAPFDSVKKEIISELKKGYAEVSLEEFNNDKNQLINLASINWFDEGINKFTKWAKQPQFFAGDYKEIINNEIEKNGDILLFSYDNGKVNLSKLIYLLDNILIMKYDNAVKNKDIKNFLIEALKTELIVEKANSFHLRDKIFNAFTKNNTLKNQIVRLYNQKEIEEKIPTPTSADLKSFYKKYKTSKYYNLEKTNLLVMLFTSLAQAESVAEQINNGIPFEKVTGHYYVKTYVKNLDGEIKPYFSEEEPYLANIAFKLKESEISDPIAVRDDTGKNTFAIVKCYKIRPAKQLTFEEARKNVLEDFMNANREELQKVIEEKLKNKYNPIINNELLNSIITHKE